MTHIAFNAYQSDISVVRDLTCASVNTMRGLTHAVFYTCAS